MGSLSAARKPHAVLVPYPAQGHTNPFLKIAKLLHSRGFHITYVHTEYNYKRLLKSKGPDSVKGLKDFRFETIPDGLPPSDADDVTQDIASLALSLRSNCVVPFRNLIKKLNDGSSSGVPSVSCIIADQFMTFTLQVAQELGIIELLFWTTSACGGLCYFHFKDLIQKGYTPLKDSSYLTNGYLDTVMDGIPGLKNMRLWDFPSFLRATAGRYDSDYMLLNYDSEEAQNAPKAWGVFLNTVYDLEREAVDALRLSLPRVYTIGSLSNLVDEIPPNNPSKSFESSLWKEDTECLKWLDTKEAGSVVYVNFGSITVMTAQQLSEFAWGLANSKCPFLWVIRPDLVRGDSAMVPQDFIHETKDRCLIISWCPQEQVLAHSSVGVFLTHCGWNSTLESISSGVPMICWPFFAEQPTNCRYICNEWRVGMAIDGNVKREQVESLVREMMVGEEGREMKKRVMMWKKSATEATEAGGSSSVDLDKMIGDILQEISQR